MALVGPDCITGNPQSSYLARESCWSRQPYAWSQLGRGALLQQESTAYTLGTAWVREVIVLNLHRDFKYSIRQLRRSPSFLFAATLTFGLGMGASTAAFSVIDGLLLESLPFRDARRIVSNLETHPQLPDGSEVTFPDYQEWRGQPASFEQIAAYSTLNPNTVTLNADGRSI